MSLLSLAAERSVLGLILSSCHYLRSALGRQHLTALFLKSYLSILIPNFFAAQKEHKNYWIALDFPTHLLLEKKKIKAESLTCGSSIMRNALSVKRLHSIFTFYFMMLETGSCAPNPLLSVHNHLLHIMHSAMKNIKANKLTKYHT